MRSRGGPWIVPAARSPSLIGEECFEFLSLRHTLPQGASAWNDLRLTHLWRYNLHYFDDLNAIGAPSRRDAHRRLLARWIDENPPGRGTGWEPYPTSQRIVNWIKWMLSGTPPDPAWLSSLAVQARWLRRRLEWHLLGNHLMANAKALLAAGLFFDGAEADAWLRRGLALLERQIDEQILDDGGHFERSPMYHALALEDVLDLINLIRALGEGTPAQHLLVVLEARVSAMLHWMRCMMHADGTLAHFNDGAEGVAPPAAEIERYAAALGVVGAHPASGLVHLPESGYLRATWRSALLLADMAPLGPDYLVGHGHADTLSFELSVHDRRIVVNGGTSRYGLGDERLRERRTAAHSTVEVAGADSSEVWSGFRVGRRARPCDVQVGSASFGAAHDGYRWLPGSPRHRRDWRLETDGLVVDDRVEPATDALARFHLAPGLTLRSIAPGTWSIAGEDREWARVAVARGSARAVPSQHAPRFGVVVATEALLVGLDDGRAVTRWSWDPDAHPFPD